MRLIDKIALNRLLAIIADLIIRLAKVFEKHIPNKINPVDPSTPVKPNRPRPLKKVVDKIDKIIPLPWRK
ncbi:MAG: hypothetical protein EBZ62_00220 [Sphingobacteriia bacterium]|nr:hypothetical protein [Sphingobacteriia bacterium]